jgi:cell division protein FtsL
MGRIYSGLFFCLMKFSLQTWIIIALLICIAVIISFWPKPVDTSEPFKREIAEKDKFIVEQSKIISDYDQKLKESTLESIKLKADNDSLTKTQVTLISDLKRKPRVIEVIKQEPEVKALVDAQDSLINLQFQRIAVLEGLEFELRQDMSKVIISCEQRFQAQVEKFALAEQRIADLEKQNRKERRKGKIAKVLVPVAAVAGLLLGVGM